MRERWALFESKSFGDGKLDVRALDGTDELNRLFHFEIQLSRPGVLSIADDAIPILESPATLWFEEDGKVFGQVHGIVSEASIDVDVESDFTNVHISLVPRAWLLTQRRGDEIFLERSIPEVVTEKLERIGLVRDVDFVLSLLDRYPVREFIVQHDETDHAFVSRLLEHIGITTFFEHKDGRDVLVLSDTPTTFRPILRPTLPVRRRREHPAAYAVRTTLRRVPQHAEVHDYNYRAPLVSLREKHNIAVPAVSGGWSMYGPHSKNTEDTVTIAKIRKEELGARHHVVMGTTTETSAHAGGTFTLSGAGGGEQELLFTRVEYRFRRASDEGAVEMAWENKFTAMPRATAHRPPRITPWPRVQGLKNAVVDGAIKGDYAELDDSGRYHLRMSYDRSGRTDLGATHPVRMMQPHAGANYGMHFPLRPGTEVLVGHVNGDPDRPVIVGTAPNPMTVSPVEARNQTQNVLRTGSNNEMVIEDQHGSERIRIHTPRENTTIQLGAIEEPEEGALTSTDANISEASRLSNNQATRRRTVIADTTTSLLGRTAIIAAGSPAVTQAAERGMETPASLSMRDISRDLSKLSTPPEKLKEKEAEPPPPEDTTEDPTRGSLWSGVGETVTANTEQATMELVRAAARTTDETLDRARGRAQGDPVGEPLEPAAILASSRTAALIGREVGFVFGDRVAALSSYNTASVAGAEVAQLKSPKIVEVAAGTELELTTAGELGVEAKLIRIVGGYYPEAEAPPLDDGTSIGVMSRKDLRFMSVEDCILICAKKNIIGTAHTGDMRLKAKKTISMSAGSIYGGAGNIKFKSSGDIELEADADIKGKAGGDMTLECTGSFVGQGATVTITGNTIELQGNVIITKNLTVLGSSNV